MKSMRFILAVVLGFMTTFLFAQEKASRKNTTAHVILYSYACPMHPGYISNKAGKCPKCGMNMIQLSAKEQLKSDVTKTYTCPVHLDIISNQPGKCPQCSKDLTLSKKEQMKADVVKLYTCGMHTDVESNEPGMCPKCGMELIERKN
jgi:ssDNA-binding Zn-finger/Zn-ribbon topoisomerase 1